MRPQNPLLKSIVNQPRHTSCKYGVYKPKVGIIPTLISKQIELAIKPQSIHHAVSKCHNECAHDHFREVDSTLHVVLGQFSFY